MIWSTFLRVFNVLFIYFIWYLQPSYVIYCMVTIKWYIVGCIGLIGGYYINTYRFVVVYTLYMIFIILESIIMFNHGFFTFKNGLYVELAVGMSRRYLYYLGCGYREWSAHRWNHQSLRWSLGLQFNCLQTNLFSSDKINLCFIRQD